MEAGSFEKVVALLHELGQQGVEYVLVGGLALGFHGLVRATEDVDLFVRPSPENIDRLKTALWNIWRDPDISEIHQEDLAGEYPVIRYGPPGEVFVVDLLARLGEAFRFEDLEAETKQSGNTRILVATPRTLYLMKRDTVRPQDRVDAEALLQMFPELRDE